MNRKISTLATLAVTLFCANVASLGFFDGCNSGCWEVGAEALYWKPCLCPFEYGTLTDQFVDGQTQNIRNEKIKPSYDWGFRVWVGMEDGCFFSTLGWTYLKATGTSSVHPGENQTLTVGLSQISVSAARAISRTRTRYNKINWRAGYYLHQGCDIGFYVFSGVRYVEIENTDSIKGADISGNALTANQASKWHGPAVEVGIGTDYHIGCGFHLAGYLGAIGGVGQQKLDVVAGVEDSTTLHVDYPTYTNCLLGLELRLGINYTYACGCVEITGEIGYEIDHYFGALARVNPDVETSSCIDVGFGGPYIGLSVGF